MSLRLLAEAQQEVDDAAVWYESRKAGLGTDFLDAVAKALTAIENSPERFARLETLTGDRNVRRFLLQQFPYNIIFEILRDETLVVAVSHARRDPNYWKGRR